MYNNGVVHLANNHHLLSHNHHHMGHVAQVAGLKNLMGKVRESVRKREPFRFSKKKPLLEIDRVAFPELEDDLILDLKDFFQTISEEDIQVSSNSDLDCVLDDIGNEVFNNSVFTVERIKVFLKEIIESKANPDHLSKIERSPAEIAMIRAIKAYVKNSAKVGIGDENKELELLKKLESANSETFIILRRIKFAASKIYLYMLANSTKAELGSKIRKLAGSKPSFLKKLKIFSKEMLIKVKYILNKFFSSLKLDALTERIKKLSKDFGKGLGSEIGKTVLRL